MTYKNLIIFYHSQEILVKMILEEVINKNHHRNAFKIMMLLLSYILAASALQKFTFPVLLEASGAVTGSALTVGQFCNPPQRANWLFLTRV